MKIIGQTNIIDFIDKSKIDTFPRTFMLYGDKGSGRHSIFSYISEKLQLPALDISSKLTPELTKIPSNMISDLDNATNIENATGYYLHVIDKLLELKNMVKTDTNMKSTIEVMLLQIARGQF